MERITTQDLPADFLKGMYQSEGIIMSSGLDRKLLELMKFRVSQINSCGYCLDIHYKEAVQLGETALRLLSVSAWRHTPYYAPQEQAVLAFAETLTHMRPEEYSHDIHDALLPFFNKEQIAALTLAIMQVNGWNRMVRSFGTEPGHHKVNEAEASEAA